MCIINCLFVSITTINPLSSTSTIDPGEAEKETKDDNNGKKEEKQEEDIK